MRVCFTTSDDINLIGGSEWSLRRVADFIADSGALVDIVCFDFDTPIERRFADIPGLISIPSWRPQIRIFQIYKTGNYPATLDSHRGVATSLERLHALNSYDLFHAFFLGSVGYLTVMTGQRVGRPVIVSARGSDINRDAYSVIRLASLQWTLQHATRLTFVSDAMLSLADTLVSCRDRADVILNSTSFNFFEAKSKRGMVKPEGFVIGGAGVLSYKKNWVELLEIVKRLISRNLPIKLLWIGEIASAERKAIHHTIQKLSLEHAVTVTGSIPHVNMVKALEMLDIFVLTSLDEGCPNACLEAMLAARPVVAFAVGALPQLIRSGDEGILLTPTDTEAFVEAVVTLYSDHVHATALGVAAQLRVLREFTPDKERAQWEACYRHAINQL